MSPRVAYLAVASLSTLVFVAILLVADSDSPVVVLAVLGAMMLFPRKWLARRIS